LLSPNSRSRSRRAIAGRHQIGTVGHGHDQIGPRIEKKSKGARKATSVRIRDELLNGEVFCSAREARIVIEQWRRNYNTVRPHSALGYRPPAPESIIPMDRRPLMH
jgi:transposase InsO family protein